MAQPHSIIDAPSDSLYIGEPIVGGTPGSVLFVGATGLLAQNNSSFFWDETNTRLGIRNATPLCTVHVGNRNSLSGVADIQIAVARLVDNTVAGPGHAFADCSLITRSGAIGYNSYDCRLAYSGSENYDHYAGFQCLIAYGSSGTISNIYGSFYAPVVTAGTATNAYGHYVSNVVTSGGGVIGTQYGFYAANLTSGGSNFAFFAAGNTPSSFSGMVGFGTTTPRRPIDSVSTTVSQARLTYTDNSVYVELLADSTGALAIGPTGTSVYPASSNATDLGGTVNVWRDLWMGRQIKLPDGSAGTPSIGFISETNSGLYRVSSNTLAITVNGSGRVRIVNDVGIRSDAAYKWASDTAFTSYDVLLVRDTAAVLAQKNSTIAQTFRIYGTATGSKYISLAHDGTNALITTTAGQIAFGTAAKVTTDTTGYVCLPSSAGAPTGVPASIPTGQIPYQIDSTNKKIYAYIGGAWLKAQVLVSAVNVDVIFG